MLDDGSSTSAVIAAIEEIGGEQAMTTLSDIARTHSVKRVRQAAKRVLQDAKSPRRKRAEKTLSGCLGWFVFLCIFLLFMAILVWLIP